MARTEATDEAIEIARSTPSLGVGCHVVLVDGEPVLTAKEVPTLVDRKTGCLQAKLGAFLQRLLNGRMDAAEIEAEARAQIDLIQSKGLVLTHIDTHKHAHMFPAVLRPVLRAARAAGICAVRNPFEAAWSLRATPGGLWVRRTQVSLLRRLEPTFHQIVAEEGFTTTNGAIGVLATGTLDAATVNCLLGVMPEGTFELVSHPGYNDAELEKAHTRLLASRETEREALMAVEKFTEIELIGFSELGHR